MGRNSEGSIRIAVPERSASANPPPMNAASKRAFRSYAGRVCDSVHPGSAPSRNVDVSTGSSPGDRQSRGPARR